MDHLYWIYQSNWISWFQWRILPKEKHGKSNGQHWVDAMDWSSIEEMAIDGFVPQSLKTATRTFTLLRTLETIDEEFVEELPGHSLTHLIWAGPAEYYELDTVLETQGESLQTLEFRCPELERPVFGLAFQVTGTHRLLTHTNNLTRLSVDIQRNGTWPVELVERIVTVPTLHTLDLWMNIQSECRRELNYEPRSRRSIEQEFGPDYCEKFKQQFGEDYCKMIDQGRDYCKGEDQFQKPYVNNTNALELFSFMGEKKQGKELEELTLWLGDWREEHDGPVYEAPWAEGRRAKVVCKVDTSVEMEDWCVVEEGKEYWEDEWPRMHSTFVGEPDADESEL